jgi:uncharacterized protein (TIGR02147 family)
LTIGISILKSKFAERQRRNPSYSLRSFSRDLGMNSGTLSAILSGKRSPGARMLEKLAKRLDLSPLEAAAFLAAFAGKCPRASEETTYRTILDMDRSHRIITEWEHYAMLSLMRTADFRDDCAWIGKRLGISASRAEDVRESLLTSGLAVPTADGLEPRYDEIDTTNDVPSAALKSSHGEMLEIARCKLTSVPLEQRQYTAMTMAIDVRRLAEAKAIIHKFRDQIAALLEDGAQTEVYQLCIQLFPLTAIGGSVAPGDGGPAPKRATRQSPG